jgi:hypothetical protein
MITLTNTLSGLENIATTVAVMVGLIRNMSWTSIFLRQWGAQYSKLEQIIQGYLNGTLVSLIGYVVTPTMDSTNLVERSVLVLFFSYFDKFFFKHDQFYNNLNR